MTPWLAPFARELWARFPRLRVTSTYRTYSQQLELWRNRARNPYPVAPPGASFHNYGRAFDMTGDPATLAAAGAVWRSWGGTWSPSDAIHFQA